MHVSIIIQIEGQMQDSDMCDTRFTRRIKIPLVFISLEKDFFMNWTSVQTRLLHVKIN